MRAEGLFARQRSKYRVATTDSRHGGPIAPNRFKGLTIKRPNQVWITDATCVLTGQGWLYLVAVLDVFTRRVIGWAMHQILDAQLVIAALRMALQRRQPTAQLIIHSDRGRQFASAAYRQLLTQHRLLASMSRKGNCYDNAFIESFWSTLKYELVYYHRFATYAQARTAIFDYIKTFYNRTRLHSSLASTRSTNPGEIFWAESALGVFGIPRRPTSFGPARAYFSAARLQQTWANDWLGSFVLSKCACASLIIRKASATSEAEISSAL